MGFLWGSPRSPAGSHSVASHIGRDAVVGAASVGAGRAGAVAGELCGGPAVQFIRSPSGPLRLTKANGVAAATADRMSVQPSESGCTRLAHRPDNRHQGFLGFTGPQLASP